MIDRINQDYKKKCKIKNLNHNSIYSIISKQLLNNQHFNKGIVWFHTCIIKVSKKGYFFLFIYIKNVPM